MPSLDFIEIDDEKFDVAINAEFASGQDDSTLLEAIQRIVYMLRQGKMGNRFEDLVSLNVTLTSCHVQLRYFTNKKREQLGRSGSGYEDVLGGWFEKYLFANVDRIRKIESHPFHVPDLSVFLELSDPFDSDPLPNP